MPRSKKVLTQEEQELYNELKKLSKRANQRIVRLERAFGKDTWATRYLKEKLSTEPLGAWTLSGRVKVNKSMSATQMRATIKFTKEFLNSKISTKKGVKEAKQKAIKTLKVRFSTDVSDLSNEEAESLYNFFEDKEVNGITNFIPGSDVLPVIETAREYNYTYENFYDTITGYIKYNKGKGNIEKLLRKIYTKYVFRGNNNTDDINILYSNVIELINNASTQSDFEEVESIIDNLLAENKIDSKEHNYLINLLNDKKGI